MGRVALKYHPSPRDQENGLEASNSGPTTLTWPVTLLKLNRVGPEPPRERSSPRKISMVSLPAELFMFRQ